MKHIKLFEQFIAEYEDKFNSHKNHNPTADIVERQLDKDTMITYGIYVKDSGPKKKGDEFMEIYTGENYVVGSKKRSHSRYFDADKIPAAYRKTWEELKSKYENELKESSLTESKSIKDHMTKAAEYKKQLMDLKKQAKTAEDPQAHQARIAAKEEQLRRVAEVIRNLRADGVKEGDEFINEGDVSLKPGLFALVSIGGSIGSKPKYPIFASGSIGNIIETSDDKDALKETAKQMRSRLSPGERKYYGMSYTVTELTPGKIRQIEMLQSAQRDSAAKDDSIEESFEYEVVTEAKDLRQLQRALDKLQNDYEAVLDDEALDAMTQLITTINSKL
jgi:hypothetical protein